jgi:hypothetical protein
MRFSFLTVMAVLTPAAAFAPRSVSTAFVTAPSSVSRTELSMAFEGTQQTSNMFEGPGPLVRERDACGVGFIANTKSGGTFISLLLLLPTCRILLSQNIPMVSRFTFHSNFNFTHPLAPPSTFYHPQTSLVRTRSFKTESLHSLAWSTVVLAAVMAFLVTEPVS